MSDPFIQYAACPMQFVPINTIKHVNRDLPVPIIQFKAANKMKTIQKEFTNIFSTKLAVKKCSNGIYDIMRQIIAEYQTNEFEMFEESITIQDVIDKIIHKKHSKIWWFRMEIDGLIYSIKKGHNIQLLIQKNIQINRKENKSKEVGQKIHFKLYVDDDYFNNSDAAIFKFGYDLYSQFIVKYPNIHVANWCFGFYYLNHQEKIKTTDISYKFQNIEQKSKITIYKDYINYNPQIKPLQSIEKYLNDGNKHDFEQGRFYHGVWRYKGSMTNFIANTTYLNALATFENQPSFFSIEKSPNRFKGFAIMKYGWNSKDSTFNKDLDKKLRDHAEKTAAGLRYFNKEKDQRIIPPFISNLIPMIKAVGAWPRELNVNQASANLYYNGRHNKNPVYVGLGPHNEFKKFDALTAVYITSSGIKSGCAINLKSNVGNGVVLIETEHMDIIRFDS